MRKIFHMLYRLSAFSRIHRIEPHLIPLESEKEQRNHSRKYKDPRVPESE
jgi:hypothetical protein